VKSRTTIIIVIVLLISAYSFNTNSSFAKDSYSKLVPKTNYVEQEPIIILNDNNFTDYGFQGNGTLANPYSIENYNITTSSEIAINIINTTKYFIIKNCFINAEKYGMLIKKTVL